MWTEQELETLRIIEKRARRAAEGMNSTERHTKNQELLALLPEAEYPYFWSAIGRYWSGWSHGPVVWGTFPRRMCLVNALNDLQAAVASGTYGARGHKEALEWIMAGVVVFLTGGMDTGTAELFCAWLDTGPVSYTRGGRNAKFTAFEIRHSVDSIREQISLVNAGFSAD